MTLTSAEAGKLLRKWNDKYAKLLQREEASSTFLAAMGEDAEDLRPAYDYAATQKELTALETQIRHLKHALNVFNATHLVGDTGMTVDELLVYIPQLTKKKEKYSTYMSRLPRTRNICGRGSTIIDYCYTNYDVEAAAADYEAASEALAKAQTALDLFNSTASFTFEP